MSKKRPAQKSPEPAPAPVRRWWQPKGSRLLLAVLAVIIVLQALSLSRLEWRFGQLQHSVGGIIDEVGSQMSLAEQIAVFGDDLNELRAVLYLPPKEYRVRPEGTASDDAALSPEADERRALFAVIDRTKASRETAARINDATGHLLALKNDTPLRDALAARQLRFADTLLEEGPLHKLVIEGPRSTVIRILVFHSDSGEWEFLSPRGGSFFRTREEFDAAVQRFAYNLDAALAEDAAYAAVRAELDQFFRETTVAEFLAQKGLRIEGDTLRNGDGAVIGLFTFQGPGKHFTLHLGEDKRTYESVDALRGAFADVIRSIDTRTIVEKKVDERLAFLQDVFADEAFRKLLEEQGLHLTAEPRWEPTRVVYPLLDAKDAAVQHIAVERTALAPIVVLDAAGMNPLPLSSLLDDPKARSTSRTSSPN